MAGASCHAANADVRGGDVKAGDLVWIGFPVLSPAVVQSDTHYTLPRGQWVEFPVGMVEVRTIATADEIKQRNKGKK